ncbi:MAG: glycoside hydrolase family 95 protein [Dysgonamonadaceae bacterium]|jgi:alpha-L-fucosidase 2|nr:glycoside hydrolase family 95 protein [Dysgonamonadaceae bacterium]
MKKTIFLFVFCFYGFWVTGQNAPLKTQYNSPAKVWESEAMPLGNGFIGAMVFGDVPIDLIQVNEHSLWSGGPGKNPAYDGGHRITADMAQRNLQIARNSLQNDMTEFSATKTAYIDGTGKVVAQNYPENGYTRAYINSLKGTKADFGSYQSLGNINNRMSLHFNGAANPNNKMTNNLVRETLSTYCRLSPTPGLRVVYAESKQEEILKLL